MRAQTDTHSLLCSLYATVVHAATDEMGTDEADTPIAGMFMDDWIREYEEVHTTRVANWCTTHLCSLQEKATFASQAVYSEMRLKEALSSTRACTMKGQCVWQSASVPSHRALLPPCYSTVERPNRFRVAVISELVDGLLSRAASASAASPSQGGEEAANVYTEVRDELMQCLYADYKPSVPHTAA